MFTRSFSTLAVALLAASQLTQGLPHARNAKRNEVVVEQTVTVWVDQYQRTVDPNNLPDCVTPPAPVVEAPKTSAPAPVATPKEEKKPVEQEQVQVPPPVLSSAKPVAASPSPAPAPVPSPEPVKEEPEPVKEERKPEPTTTKVEPTPEPTKEPVKEEPVVKTPSNGRAVVYSPYHAKENGAGRRCKSEDEIKADIQALGGFSLLRLYSTDCKQVSTCLKYGQHKLFIGLENTNNPENEYNDLVNAIKENGNAWDRIDTVSLGNEVTNFNKFAGGTAAYAASINSLRERLRKDGYNGAVVGADTFVALMNDPTGAVCKASDYVAANAHPFFDGGYSAEEAGKFLSDMSKAMKEKFEQAGCTGKEIRFAETGWPKQGGANRKAIPNAENQAIAVKKILEAFPNTILFTAFDDKWKEDTAATLGTEQHWGIEGITSL